MESFDQRNNSGVFGSSAAVPRPPSNNNRLNAFNQMGAGGSENPKPGIGIPPSHPSTNLPYSQYIASQNQHHLGSQRLRSPNLSPGSSSSSSHSRSMSQPSFFSLDSLPPLSPLTYRDPAASPVAAATSFGDSMDVSMEENLGSTHTAPSLTVNRGHSLPPRKGHRRSNSDSPLGISGLVQSYSQSVPTKNVSDRDNSVSKGENTGFEKPIQLVLKEPNKDMVHFDCFTGEAMGKKEDCIDDLFNAYMNLDNIQNMNFPGMEDKDLDSRTSGSKTVESSDNEVESHANGKTTSAQGATSSYKEERKEGIKRGSSGDIAPVGRHRRSFSLDSSIGDFQLEDESSKLPPLQNRFGQHSPSNSIDGKTSDTSIEFVKREFSSDELKKIMESDKLTEIAMADPKRAKRILANRVSAARSKERKTRYISELEHKVQTLQAETTSLSTQFTKLQMDNSELKSLNNEYKLKLQALEQQSQLKDALNETLDAEVRRLRRTVANLGGDPLL
ncbi:bZIP transcription factor 29-like [Arachis stenosperma]|uniref:bZIP transcription factor 29-like n=1 Tax=Arachis stenosperma TaxID=217475 RepID=UPI0025AB7B8F|nr:bZIP transcription factor 29-like [Arachis stenosperma]